MKSETVMHIKVAISIIIYCLSVAAVPIYNKKVFSGSTGFKKFPYPITTAFLQLGFVSVCCGFLNIFQRALSPQHRREKRSWLFGPHFLYKLKHASPVGVLFGFKYGITNWGLQLVPTGMHLLLQSTDLVWTCLAARVINSEKLNLVAYLAAVLVTLGSCLISIHAVNDLHTSAVGLIVNLLTPLFLALCISTLRKGTEELTREDNCLKGTVSPGEFTCIKLMLSSSVCLILSFILENGSVKKHAWWVAISQQPIEATILLLLGGVFVLIFQVNLTWLAGLTSAVTVGIAGGMKIVPQWGINLLFQLKVDVSTLNLVGAALVLLGSALYAWFQINKPAAGHETQDSTRELALSSEI